MKFKFLILFLFISLLLQAQERFVDTLFKSQKAIERIYNQKDGENLKLYIYEPEHDKSTKRPVIMFMHGGGFGVGSPHNKDEVKFAKECAQRGFVAVQIGYRLTRKGNLLDVIFLRKENGKLLRKLRKITWMPLLI